MLKRKPFRDYAAVVHICQLLVIAGSLLTSPNFATAANWINTDLLGGDWDDGANWSTGNPLDNTVCEAGECVEGDAYISNGGTANFDNVIDFAQHGRRIEISDGTVNQMAGNLFPTSWIDLGTVAGKTGNYNLSAGATLVMTMGNLRVGVDDFGNPLVGPGETGGGSGVFTTSGTADFSNEIIVGFDGPGTGTMNINGGTVTGTVIKAGFQRGGTGIYNQTAGTVTANLWVDLASNSGHPDTHGTYNLSGGMLISKGGDGVVIGNAGIGVFNQDGGQLDSYLDVRLGHGSGGNGTYTQTDGIVNVGRRLRIGQNNNGTGEYNLEGGTLNITNVPGSSATPEWIEVGGSEGAGLPPFGNPKSNGVGTFNISGGTLNNPGALNIGIQGTGTVTQTGGTVNTSTSGSGNVSLANDGGAGTYNLQGGVLNVGGQFIEAGFAGSDFNFTGGTLLNVGTFAASLEQEGGILAPGASAGTMDIDNDYNLSAGTYHVEIDSGNNDLLDIGVNADLDFDSNGLGTTLAIELLGGFSPDLGSSFTVLDAAGTLSGQFANLDTSLAALTAGLSWDVIYNAQTVVLAVVQDTGTPGDIDGDGDVDGTDFLAIQSNNPSGIPEWEDDFGTNGSLIATSTAVPEPSGSALLIVSFIAGWHHRFRRLSRCS